jgi:hypothetical protein
VRPGNGIHGQDAMTKELWVKDAEDEQRMVESETDGLIMQDSIATSRAIIESIKDSMARKI